MARRSGTRSARDRGPAVLPELEDRTRIYVAALPPRKVARDGRMARADLGAQITARFDSHVALTVIRGCLVSFDDAADQLAAGCRADCCAGLYVCSRRPAHGDLE